MLKKWQRAEIANTLTTLSQVLEGNLEEGKLETVYMATKDKSKIVKFDKYNHPIVLTDDEIFHNLKVYTTKLMNKLVNDGAKYYIN